MSVRESSGSLHIADLTVSYGPRRVVTAANLEVAPGSMTALIGPNGAGKSTLLRAALELIPRESGTVTVNGRPLGRMRKEVAYVPQRSEVDWNFPITVEQTAKLGTYPKPGLFAFPRATATATTVAALEQVDLLDLKDRPISQLSGGQQQRMFLARAIAQQARLFLLDEHFAGVDAASEKVVVAVLNQLKKAGTTILIFNNDSVTLTKYFEQVIVLSNSVRGLGVRQEVLEPPARLWAKNLLAAMDGRAGWRSE